jgi:hypothetical protein
MQNCYDVGLRVGLELTDTRLVDNQPNS